MHINSTRFQSIASMALLVFPDALVLNITQVLLHILKSLFLARGVHLSEGRGQNNQHPMTTISEWWYSSVVLVYDLHRGMCCKPSGKVQEGREGLLMGNICDW